MVDVDQSRVERPDEPSALDRAASTLRIVESSGRPWRRRIFVRMFVLDLFLVSAAVLAAMLLRFGVPEDVADWGPSQLSYQLLSVMFVVAWMVALLLYQSYRPSLLGVGLDEYRVVLRATAAVFGLFAIISMVFKMDYSRGYFAIALPIGAISLMLGRVVNRRALVGWRQEGGGADGALVVGSPVEVRHVASGISHHPSSGYTVLAVATDTDQPGEFELADGTTVPDLGSIGALPDRLPDLDYRSVIVAGQSRVNRHLLRQFGWAMEDSHRDLVVASAMTDVAGPRIHWRPIEGLPLMSVELPRYSGAKFLAKRVFDLTVSGLLIALLSPVLLATMVAIKIDSRGPVFFHHRRIGVRGESFRMTKFRSMVDGADKRFEELSARAHEGNDVQFKLRDDPRITRVGAVIRRYSIDELPQLFDVFMGRMSLVGPRPHVQKEVDMYADHVRRRLYVKPGITGPWQVGGRSNLSWDESVRKDLYYVENWSFSGDVLILFQTVKAVLAKEGAY